MTKHRVSWGQGQDSFIFVNHPLQPRTTVDAQHTAGACLPSRYCKCISVESLSFLLYKMGTLPMALPQGSLSGSEMSRKPWHMR